MTLNFTWINLLILFGAIQALLFSILLLFQKKHPGAVFFSAFIFVFAYNGFETFNWSSGLDQHYIFFDLFGFIVIYGVGPSLYLYTTKLLFPGQQISRKLVLAHYGLTLFQFIVRIGILVYHLLWINKVFESSVSAMHLMNIVWFYAEPLSVIIFVGYYVATIFQYRKSKAEHVTKLHVREKQTIFNWVKALLIPTGALAVLWPVTVLAPGLFNVPFGVHYYPIELALVVFTYWIVLYGYHKVRTIRVKKPDVTNLAVEQETQLSLDRLQHAMEEQKLYLDPALTITKLASQTGIPARAISTILNQYQQINFNDFVNRYRVKDVQRKLTDPENQHLTISGMAFDAGFNSQATFQRVFKNHTGMSPKEYMAQRLRPASIN